MDIRQSNKTIIKPQLERLPAEAFELLTNLRKLKFEEILNSKYLSLWPKKLFLQRNFKVDLKCNYFLPIKEEKRIKVFRGYYLQPKWLKPIACNTGKIKPDSVFYHFVYDETVNGNLAGENNCSLLDMLVSLLKIDKNFNALESRWFYSRV